MNSFKYFNNYSPSLLEIHLDMASVTVETETRFLRVAWTHEDAIDLEAYHNIDAEQELTRILSEEISREVDRRRTIANDLVAVQPLELPRGILHYMDFKYKENILTTFKFFN